MKKLLTIFAILGLSLTTSAGTVTLINNTPVTFTNATIGVSGGGLMPPLPQYVNPAFTITPFYSGSWSSVEDFIVAVTGSSSGSSYFSSAYFVFVFRMGSSAACPWYGFLVDPTAPVYTACTGYTVTYTLSGTNVTIVINP